MSNEILSVVILVLILLNAYGMHRIKECINRKMYTKAFEFGLSCISFNTALVIIFLKVFKVT
jgi:hypothetical protein